MFKSWLCQLGDLRHVTSLHHSTFFFLATVPLLAPQLRPDGTTCCFLAFSSLDAFAYAVPLARSCVPFQDQLRSCFLGHHLLPCANQALPSPAPGAARTSKVTSTPPAVWRSSGFCLCFSSPEVGGCGSLLGAQPCVVVQVRWLTPPCLGLGTSRLPQCHPSPQAQLILRGWSRRKSVPGRPQSHITDFWSPALGCMCDTAAIATFLVALPLADAIWN